MTINLSRWRPPFAPCHDSLDMTRIHVIGALWKPRSHTQWISCCFFGTSLWLLNRWQSLPRQACGMCPQVGLCVDFLVYCFVVRYVTWVIILTWQLCIFCCCYVVVLECKTVTENKSEILLFINTKGFRINTRTNIIAIFLPLNHVNSISLYLLSLFFLPLSFLPFIFFILIVFSLIIVNVLLFYILLKPDAESQESLERNLRS